LDVGVNYIQVAAGYSHTVYLRSDGRAVAFGRNCWGQCRIPRLTPNVTYTEVSAGACHSVLLRSDGVAVARGWNKVKECDIPPLEEGLKYIQISAGSWHTVLLRNDGNAVACGDNCDGQCDIPPLEKGVSYAQVSAGRDHTVLLRSDGTAVAFGLNDDGQCNLPLLEEGVSYTQVSAGRYRTVLLRCDGRVVACGKNSAIPPDFNALVKDRVLQADFSYEDNDEIIVRCFGLHGVEVLQLRAGSADLKRASRDLARWRVVGCSLQGKSKCHTCHGVFEARKSRRGLKSGPVLPVSKLYNSFGGNLDACRYLKTVDM
jgi:alpha-tubulin suppressor-like RCC1 family protein